jgi:hypothetical protein
MLAYSDSFIFHELRDRERPVRPTTVTVTCLMPGATETEFFRRADMLDTKVGTVKKDDPADVAEHGFKAMVAGEDGVVSGWQNKLEAAAAHVIPSERLAKKHSEMAAPGHGEKVAPTTTQLPIGTLLPSVHWDGMTQPHVKSTSSSPLQRNRLPLRGRRAPQVRIGRTALTKGMRRGRAKFVHYFPKGFRDSLYEDWERGYKWAAHRRWTETLDQASFRKLLKAGKHREIATQAVAIEARTNLLFSFEKMALRDGVKSSAGARTFAQGLYDFLHGTSDMEQRFTRWCEVVARLPRRQTRVLTWPIVTVFGFIAAPASHIFLKPTVTRRAAEALGVPFEYRSRPIGQPMRNCCGSRERFKRTCAICIRAI